MDRIMSFNERIIKEDVGQDLKDTMPIEEYNNNVNDWKIGQIERNASVASHNEIVGCITSDTNAF